MNTRRTTLLIAVLLALGTGFLTLNYLSSLRNASQAAGQPRPVLVASQDIPARSPITAAMVSVTQRPASVVEPDAIADPKQAVGAIALITIPKDSTISQSKIGTAANAALPVRLQPGMRAVSIAIDKVKGVSGLAQPGDRVDVIAIPPRQGGDPPRALTILRGVRILALGATLENTSATPSPEEQNSTTATLEVTPQQADLLAAADQNTVLRLALRSPKEKIRSLPTEQLYGWYSPPTVAQPAPASADATFAAKLADAFARSAATNTNNGGGGGGGYSAPARRSYSAPAAPSGPVQVIDGDHVSSGNP